MKSLLLVTLLLLQVNADNGISVRNALTEISKGNVKTYSSANSSKNKGVNLMFYYPSSWLAKESLRPKLVTHIVSQGGLGFEQLLLYINKLDESYANSEIIEGLKDIETIKAIVPPNSKLLNTRKPFYIDNKPAVSFEYSNHSAAKDNIGNIDIDHFGICYLIMHKNYQVQLFFMLSIDSKTTEQTKSDFRSLANLVTNTIVIP